LGELLDFGLLETDKDHYLDVSLSQLQNENANLFCRKEVEHFLQSYCTAHQKVNILEN
jgi:hypothetical protein